jgi:hypothetical protein
MSDDFCWDFKKDGDVHGLKDADACAYGKRQWKHRLL